ncbi:MAG: peptidoglycan bridge formation glycyltransferase FemA/FemB family protein [Candidatus Peregrinibacteria bacterium]
MIISPNLWQSDEWNAFQNAVGNTSFWEREKNAKALVITRKPHWLKFWKKAFWEIPRGPIGNFSDFPPLLKKILEEAKSQNIAFLRVYPPFFSFGEELKNSPLFWESLEPLLKTYPHAPAPEIFPEHTLVLDLTQTEDEILAAMKQKGRYNIRLAEKKGVTIFEEKTTENFWRILQETASRDGFTSNKKPVYQKMVESFGENGILISAKDETGEVLASKIFVKSGDMAVYYYGASSENKRNLMAPYLLQWAGICWAKSKGAKVYDFLGVAPENDEAHRLKTVSEFKLKFGGKRVVCEKGIDFFL